MAQERLNVFGEPFDPFSRKVDFVKAGIEAINQAVASGGVEALLDGMREWHQILISEAESRNSTPQSMSKADIMHLGALPVLIGMAEDKAIATKDDAQGKPHTRIAA